MRPWRPHGALAGVVALLLLVVPPAIAAPAASPQAAAVARFFVPFLLPAQATYSASDWDTVHAVAAVRWRSSGPTMLDKPTPEGDYFAMPGQVTVDGRQAALVANGARTMVFNYYLLDPAPAGDPQAVAAGFESAGYTLAPARCPIGGGAYPDGRRWYRIAYPDKRPAYLYTSPIRGNASGFVLYIGGLPTMSEKNAAVFTDDCAGGTAPPPGLRTGGEAVVTLLDRLVRPASADASLPWAEVEALPSITWHAPPQRLTIPLTEGGADSNPYTLSGVLQTPTTESETRATGSAQAATRFYFRYLDHVRPGEVFAGLRRKGYRITAVRCGKAYLKMSENWFDLRAPGRRPAILYRLISNDGGPPRIGFVLRVDGVMPPIEPGQRAASRGGCRG